MGGGTLCVDRDKPTSNKQHRGSEELRGTMNAPEV